MRNAGAGVPHLAAKSPRGALADGLQGDLHPACRRELDRISDHVEQTLPEADGIEACPSHRAAPPPQVELLGVGLRVQQRDHAGHHRHRVGRRRGDLELAGLHLAEVQHVVDELGQHVAAGQSLAQEVGALSRELLATKQVQDAHDAVHRGADFVADGSEEVGLRRGRPFGLVTGFRECGDVLADPVHLEAAGRRPAAASVKDAEVSPPPGRIPVAHHRFGRSLLCGQPVSDLRIEVAIVRVLDVLQVSQRPAGLALLVAKRQFPGEVVDLRIRIVTPDADLGVVHQHGARVDDILHRLQQSIVSRHVHEHGQDRSRARLERSAGTNDRQGRTPDSSPSDRVSVAFDWRSSNDGQVRICQRRTNERLESSH